MVILWVDCYKIFIFFSFLIFFINNGDFCNSNISNKEHMIKVLCLIIIITIFAALWQLAPEI